MRNAKVTMMCRIVKTMKKVLQTTIYLLFLSKIGEAQVVLPQFADGRLPDGSSYRSTIIVENNGSGDIACTVELFGLPVQRYLDAEGRIITPSNNSLSSRVPRVGFLSLQSFGTATISVGYATVLCDSDPLLWHVSLLLSLYNSSGLKISEATIPSTALEPPSNPSAAAFVVDHRGGARTAVAMANHEISGNRLGQYKIFVTNSDNVLIGSGIVRLDSRTQTAKFLDEWITLPPNFVGKVVILPQVQFPGSFPPFLGPSIYAIGLHNGPLCTLYPLAQKAFTCGCVLSYLPAAES